jgi:hypothetical protein
MQLFRYINLSNLPYNILLPYQTYLYITSLSYVYNITFSSDEKINKQPKDPGFALPARPTFTIIIIVRLKFRSL